MLHLLILDIGIFFFNVALSNFACGDYIIFMLQSIKFDVAITWNVLRRESFQRKRCINIHILA